MLQKINPDLWDKIEKLDLRAITHKLTHPEEKYGWPNDIVDLVEKAYRKYLYLAGTYGETKSVVPTKIIDEFWHMHILDTRKYAEDCQNLFGKTLHHYPYLGIRFEGDRKNLDNAFVKTQQIWQEVFGEEMSSILSSGLASGNFNTGKSAIYEVDSNFFKELQSQSEQCDTCGAGSCAASNCGSNSCNGYIDENVPEYLQS